MRIAGPVYEFEEEHTIAVRLVDPEREEQEVLTAGFGPMGEPPPQHHCRGIAGSYIDLVLPVQRSNVPPSPARHSSEPEPRRKQRSVGPAR
jgi:hypothetical protein